MPEDRKIDVAIWQSQDETRAVEVAGLLETAGFGVHDLDFSTAAPMVILVLPGEGNANLASTCVSIAEAYPSAPAVVLHTATSESAHPSIDHHVFELMPASLPMERLPDHLRSVLARWQRFEELKHSAATLQHLESTTDLIYFDFRPDTGTFCPSDQLRQIIGHFTSDETMAPSPLLDCIHSDDRALFAGTLFEAARSGTPFCVQIRLTDARGHQRHFRTRGRAFGALDEGHSARVFAVCEDMTDHMQRLAEAEARSRIDDLTGLGNRRFFDDCLASALARAKREREDLALLYIDLDRFKLINDTLGHDAGDQLLRVISARLSDAVRANDIVCLDHESPGPEARVSRLGGDEFTVLLSGIHGPADAELVAGRMLEAIREPVEIAGQMLTPSASLGISLFPGDGQTTDELRKRADAALYAAKGGGGGFRFFKQSMEDGAVRRLSLESELRQALEADEIELHYQPRIDFTTGSTVGAEALIRWSSPTLGRVTEKEILRIAEDSGIITRLGRWALITACREAVFWASTREEPCRLALNISPLQFEQDDVFDAVVDALKRSGLPPELLDIEITEGLLLRDDASIEQSLGELRRMGVRVVLDEFGKGYSALAVLMSQPIDVLKLDRRLIETVAPDGEGSPLLRNVIRMANDLSLIPIAAGVSHADQAEFLASQGCNEMQGFYFSAAIPAEAFRDKNGFN
ncbi:MAG: putative bifunctional diguanylate cyclase/phosphodiesterase [Myxococcota bacterium]